MKKFGFVIFVMLLFAKQATGFGQAVHSISLSHFSLSLNEEGVITKISDQKKETNYVYQGEPSYFFSILVDHKILHPQKLVFNKKEQIIQLTFPNGTIADIQFKNKNNFITFELISITNVRDIETVIWGPICTVIKESVGETIGIVHDSSIAIGIQALNKKTLGGYPWMENDDLPQVDMYSQPDFDSLLTESKRYVLYSVEAARATDYGSNLQAFTRNRDNSRIIKNWGAPYFEAPAYQDGGVIGSKIALFMCPAPKVLDVIEQIELGEGLPHPMIDGIWVKRSPVINSSYLIMNFNENNIDSCIQITKKLGYTYLYHEGPFASWGHFPLDSFAFPNGYQGMKICVTKAAKEGIHIGTHMLTNFITPSDSYITPIPDKRLAVVGSNLLAQDLKENDTIIPILGNDQFFQELRNADYNKNIKIKSVIIDEEIIRFENISEKPPYYLTGCKRGAFGTQAAPHSKGVPVSKLVDHAYQVFLGNAALNQEIAENMADFMNFTGVRMLDFDGLEGTYSTGMGKYGEILFADAWYQQLNDSLKNGYVLGASRPAHYFWHYYSRMNWGEPWYAGFRESQTEYRFFNQKYYQRNYMPAMLGWFMFTSKTSIEDINWLMARSAGYDAGFALYASLKSFQENGKAEIIMKNINLWETARREKIFPEKVREKMRDLKKEFILEKGDVSGYKLTEIHTFKQEIRLEKRQPGEPVSSYIEVYNPIFAQPVRFIIQSKSETISQIKIKIDQIREIVLPVDLNKGEIIKYTGSNEVIVYNKNWKIIQKLPISNDVFMIQKGEHTIEINGQFESDEAVSIQVEFQLLGETEILQ